MTPAAAAATPEAIDTRFGRFALDGSEVIEMAEPLAGFEHCRHYVLLSPPEIAPLVCLQGLDSGRPSFLAVGANIADPTFRGVLSAGDRQRLGLPEHAAPGAPALWLALVRVGTDDASANLRAPVVINPARMLGVQVVPADSVYSTEHPLPLG